MVEPITKEELTDDTLDNVTETVAVKYNEPQTEHIMHTNEYYLEKGTNKVICFVRIHQVQCAYKKSKEIKQRFANYLNTLVKITSFSFSEGTLQIAVKFTKKRPGFREYDELASALTLVANTIVHNGNLNQKLWQNVKDVKDSWTETAYALIDWSHFTTEKCKCNNESFDFSVNSDSRSSSTGSAEYRQM